MSQSSYMGAEPVGEKVMPGYWLRSVRAYGTMGDFMLVRLYWPTSDPRPDAA